MRIAYLDCFSGISGDMFLGALLECGVSPKLLEDTVAALDIGAQLEISHVVRSGISATKVEVYAHGEKDLPRDGFGERPGVHDHSHGHLHDSEHSHHSHHEADAHEHQSGKQSSRARMRAPREHEHARPLTEIRKIIGGASISGTAKATAIRIFETLGVAESKIHNTSIEKVHFHEVGAVDAMADIVCAAAGSEALGIDEWVCSPLNVGGGTVKCAHGILPVPAPATLEILQGAPVYSSGPQVELVTPTGAAIVKTLASRFGEFPAMKIARAGYGAGTHDFPRHPNVVRLAIGDAIATSTPAGTSKDGSDGSKEMIAVLEANLDDLSPQVLAYTMEQLLGAGALDVFCVPVQMKKGRPGAVLTVLSKPDDADRMTKLIFAETTTLGIRRREEQRQVLARHWETVQTSWGPVRIKIASMNGTISNYAPEYEDCRQIAAEQHVPLKTVLETAMQQYLSRLQKA